MNKIIVEQLRYKYPNTNHLALNHISFEIKEGECIGVIGSNSSGKSSLCQALVGLIPHFFHGAYGGKVFIDGLEVKTTEISKLVTKVGLVFQNPFTQLTGSKYTVFEEIAFGLENLGLGKKEMMNRIEHSLDLLNIHSIRNKNPFDLSGGQMQRVAIASILAMRPEILVLDEPTSQLDPRGTEEVFKVIDTLKKEGITVIIAEHKIEKLAQYADKILALSKGEMIGFDTPQAIFSRDDLENYGIDAPVFTKICKALQIKNRSTGLYPVTLEETSHVVVNHNE